MSSVDIHTEKVLETVYINTHTGEFWSILIQGETIKRTVLQDVGNYFPIRVDPKNNYKSKILNTVVLWEPRQLIN